MLIFTEHQLISYEGAVDLTTGNIIYDFTREVFYQDVISVSHNTMTEEIDLNKLSTEVRDDLKEWGILRRVEEKATNGILQIVDKDFYEIALADGEKIFAVLRDVKLATNNAYSYEEYLPSESEAMISTIRNLVRSKKAEVIGRSAKNSITPETSEAFDV